MSNEAHQLPDFLHQPRLTDDGLQGRLLLPALPQEILVTLEIETKNPQVADYAGLIPMLQQLIAHFTPVTYLELLAEVAAELTQSAYEQDDEASQNKSFMARQTTRLRQELRLTEILVFSAGVVLYYEAPTQYPGSIITVQLTDTFDLDDLAVNA